MVAAGYEALAKRRRKSRSRGRQGAPAGMVLRFLILMHSRNGSYCAPERAVRVPRLHPRGRRQDARRQDHRSLVLRCGAEGRQTDPPKDGEDRAGHRGEGRAQDAGGHHGVETNIHNPTDSAIWLIAQVAASLYSALRTRETKRAGTTATIGRFFVSRYLFSLDGNASNRVLIHMACSFSTTLLEPFTHCSQASLMPRSAPRRVRADRP
jgi:hypothetical protein